MHLYIDLLGLKVPGYGLMIATGLVLANVIACFFLKKFKLDFNDLLILEACTIGGGFLGAKILFLIVSADKIDFSRILEPAYFNMLIGSGFVFYGGLIGGLISVFAAGYAFKIDAKPYARHLIFAIPFIHGFGRLGCYNAGCCYGVPYDGFGAVVFPEGCAAPAGISLFPIQLAEAFCLLIISMTILLLHVKFEFYYTLELYLILYGIVRFVLENYRYDAIRGHYGILSTSQWISIGMLLLAVCLIIRHKIKTKNRS